MKTRPLFLFIVVALAVIAGLVYSRRTGLVPVSGVAAAVLPAAPPLTIFYNAEEAPGEKLLVAQVVQQQLKQAGIMVKLEPVPSAVFNDRLGKGQFECTFALWYLDYDDAEGFLTDFYSKSSFRMAKYSSARYDEAYLAALFAPTEEAKREKYRAAARILSEDLPWVPLYSNSDLFLMRPEAEGFRSNAYQYYDYRRVDLPAIRAASDVEVQTFDPAQAYDLASKHMVTQSYEGLIALDEKNQIVPALATSWTFSPAGDRLSFHLREGVHFHAAPFLSGEPGRSVTAADVKASFERLIKANSPYGYIFDHVTGIDEFKSGGATGVAGFVVDGPLDFSIQLQKPFPTMLPWLLAPAAYVLPADVPANYDFTKGSCGTGPFILREWNGTSARFDANPHYWLKEGIVNLPRAQSLTLRIVKDANSLLLAFKQGELDILNVPLPLYDAVFDGQGQPKVEWRASRFREVRLNNLKFLAFNMESTPWGKSPELRRRVDQALDRNVIVRQLFHGKARAATSVIPDGVAGFR